MEALYAQLTSGDTAGHVSDVRHRYTGATGEFEDFGTR